MTPAPLATDEEVAAHLRVDVRTLRRIIERGDGLDVVGHAGGLTSDTYTTASALWPAMVEAVALVPGWTPAGVSFEARRVRSVSTRTR